MGIAIFTDIHGNLEALEAILKDIKKKRRKIDAVYYLGDAISFGPNSSECLKLLQKYKVNCVIGNHEQRMVRYDKSMSVMSYAGIKHKEYIFHQLDNDDIRFIKSMPQSIKINYKGFNLYFSHYSRDNDGLVREDYEDFSEGTLEDLFGYTGADVVFFGHAHQHKIIINPSGRSFYSLGPSGCTHTDTTFYTFFDIRDIETRNLLSYRIEIKFDRKKFVEKMLADPIPEKENFAKMFFGIEMTNDQIISE